MEGVPDDEELSAGALEALEAHLHRRTRYRIRRKHHEQKFEIVGGVPGTSVVAEADKARGRAALAAEEVDDSWFGVKEEFSRRTRVKLKLSRGREKGRGMVAEAEEWVWGEKEGGKGKSKRKGKEKTGVPEVVVEMDGAEGGAGWSDGEGGAAGRAGSIAMSELGFGGSELVGSPTETLNSLDSFPFDSDELTPSTSRGRPAEPDSQPPSAPLSRTQTSVPPPSGQNSLALPTLVEHRTLSHTSSYHTAHTELDDSNSDDVRTPGSDSAPTPSTPTRALTPLDAAPAHGGVGRSDSQTTVLTVDASRPNPKRRDSRSDFSGNPRRLRDLRPHDVQHALARRKARLARVGRGAASMTEAGEAGEIEKALERAGMAAREEERKEWVYLVEHQRG